MTIALILTALGVIAASVGLSFYLSKLLSNAMSDTKKANSDWKLEVEVKASLLLKVGDLERLNDEVQAALTDKLDELAREVAARKKVEAHAQQLLEELAKSGSPSAAAAQLRKELDALAALGTPNATSTAVTQPMIKPTR